MLKQVIELLDRADQRTQLRVLLIASHPGSCQHTHNVCNSGEFLPSEHISLLGPSSQRSYSQLTAKLLVQVLARLDWYVPHPFCHFSLAASFVSQILETPITELTYLVNAWIVVSLRNNQCLGILLVTTFVLLLYYVLCYTSHLPHVT